jgi:hypothetical protein
MTALGRLGELSSFGLPILVGASRKRFISRSCRRSRSSASGLDRGASDRGAGRRKDHPDSRRGGNRSGAAGGSGAIGEQQ